MRRPGPGLARRPRRAQRNKELSATGSAPLLAAPATASRQPPVPQRWGLQLVLAPCPAPVSAGPSSPRTAPDGVLPAEAVPQPPPPAPTPGHTAAHASSLGVGGTPAVTPPMVRYKSHQLVTTPDPPFAPSRCPPACTMAMRGTNCSVRDTSGLVSQTPAPAAPQAHGRAPRAAPRGHPKEQRGAPPL